MGNEFGLKPPPKPGRPKATTSWPAWYYSADGDKRIFNGPEEIPEGWATSRGNAASLARRKAEEAAANQPRLTREEIIAELKDRAVKFNYKSDTGQLWQLLRDIRERYGADPAAEKAVDNPNLAQEDEPVPEALVEESTLPISKVDAKAGDATFKRLPAENREAALAAMPAGWGKPKSE